MNPLVNASSVDEFFLSLNSLDRIVLLSAVLGSKSHGHDQAARFILLLATQ